MITFILSILLFNGLMAATIDILMDSEYSQNRYIRALQQHLTLIAMSIWPIIAFFYSDLDRLFLLFVVLFAIFSGIVVHWRDGYDFRYLGDLVFYTGFLLCSTLALLIVYKFFYII